MTRTSAQRKRLCSSERGLALAPLASLAGCHPPTGGFAGGIGFSKKIKKGENTEPPARRARWRLYFAFMCLSEGVNPSDHTSGWRIGTQPASFSYSSIASAILVVMLAEHCGKQEAVQGGTVEEEEEEEKRGSVRNTGDVQVTAHIRKDV